VPLELAHLPFRKATFEDYVGERGREELGKKKWHHAVAETIELLVAATVADYVVLGGGNAKKIEDELPPNVRLGANQNAFLGGFRLWDPSISAPPTG
jgi:polyphosphate glucokinase